MKKIDSGWVALIIVFGILFSLAFWEVVRSHRARGWCSENHQTRIVQQGYCDTGSEYIKIEL